jgi:mono/diheme cytochrome c family protein
VIPALQLPVLVAVAVLALAWRPALAQPSTSTSTNVAAGRALSDRDCIACHQQKFSPPEAIYLRPDRRVNTLAQLKAQVARCNAELPTQYFPEEEEQLVDYLNATFYRLPR